MTQSPSPISTRINPIPSSAQRTTRLLCALLLLGSLGCLHDPTVGPLYGGALPPKPNFARVLLYRIDPHHSFSTVEVRFDQEAPLQVLDEEYITLELREGTHEIAFRLRRHVWWPSWTWRTQRIRARDGETIFFEIAVGVTQQRNLPGSDSEIAGRAPGTAGEQLTIRTVSESEALERIRMTHLHVP